MSAWKQNEKNIAVVGHRGFCSDYPENTIPSFLAAREHKVDIIEFDINMSSDGELIVMHDNTLDRTTNGTGYSHDMTFAELRKLNAACKFQGANQFESLQIPTLKEVMDIWMAADYDVIFNVEIKEKTTECVDKTLAVLREYDVMDRMVLDCFDANITRYAHSIDPTLKLQGFPGWLMKNFSDDVYSMLYGIGIPIKSKGIMRPDEAILADMKLAHDHHLDPWLFCADTEEEVYKCIEFGATTITGNNIIPVINVLEKTGLRMK